MDFISLNTFQIEILCPLLYQDIAANIIITDSPPCFTAGTRHSSLGVLQTYSCPDVGKNMKNMIGLICLSIHRKW